MKTERDYNYLKRFSCRSFASEALSDEQISFLLKAAVRAPSAGNIQPWRFFVVRNSRTRSLLAKASFGQDFVYMAPLSIVVCAVARESAEGYGERGETLYCYQDTAAAVENILLAATDLGLGSCWVGAFEEEMVSAVLELPSELRPVAVIPIGYPSKKASFTPRRPLKEVVTYID